MDLQEKAKKYLTLSYRYLSYRNRSEKEVREYLLKKNASPEIIESVIAQLLDQRFLNDETFARSWVSARSRLRPKGKRVLKMELREKGISDDLIDIILSEDNEDLSDELTQAKEIIATRMVRMKDHPRQEIYQKVGSFLARRGYSWEISKKAIDATLEPENVE